MSTAVVKLQWILRVVAVCSAVSLSLANNVSSNGGDGGGNDGGDDDGLSTAEILYTVFGSGGGVGLVIVIGSVVGWCLKRRRDRRNSETPRPESGSVQFRNISGTARNIQISGSGNTVTLNTITSTKDSNSTGNRATIEIPSRAITSTDDSDSTGNRATIEIPSRAAPKSKGSLTSTPTLPELLQYFDEVAKWDDVCPFLLNDATGAKTSMISDNNHGNVARCRKEMLGTFLQEISNPTWQDVVNALRNGKYNNLADRIEGDL